LTAVHQALASVGPHDAVSEQARVWRSLLGEAGYGGGDHAAWIAPGVRDVARCDRLRPAPGDLLVIRYSAWSPALARLLELPQRKLLVYHNITPARYLWNHSATIAAMCAIARVQLPAFVRAATLVTADSDYNAAELVDAGAQRVRVVPILIDPGRLRACATPPLAAGPLILSVGRLVPNKRHDLVLAAFAAYQAEHAPDARLVCVGEAITPAYGRLLARLAADAGARNVTFTGPIAQPAVNALYAGADALLHLSEHEGFCVPLLEAFHFGLPVVARARGAMPAVGADAVLWTDADPAVTAELLAAVVADADLRAELARRGRARLDAFSHETTTAAVLEAVEAALR
jgi:glycosyltransferase involved in cell wall biosynthesis